MKPDRPIRVLIVDDSALVRKMLVAALAADKRIEVVGTAPDAYIARDKILALHPDVITLDIEMPRMDGISFLKKLMQHKPLPVIVISSLGRAGCQTSLDALRAGAVEILAKPNGPNSVGELSRTLAEKIHAAAAARMPAITQASSRESNDNTPLAIREPAALTSGTSDIGDKRVIAIGASTGGPMAVSEVLRRLPQNTPPILIVQHMPEVFTKHFAERLDRECHIAVKEAEDGDELRRGRALIARGNSHMMLKRHGSGYRVWVGDGPSVCFSRPSVDVLFSSVAKVAGEHAIGVILTGMGSDGARGMLEMRNCGAFTLAQNEETCVVFGMPKEAIHLGAAKAIVPLDRIAGALLRQLSI
jgi:two-component system chemotaxis response regulator CheB